MKNKKVLIRVKEERNKNLKYGAVEARKISFGPIV
jgi:hypothetical protein